jgi:hypothetical protein
VRTRAGAFRRCLFRRLEKPGSHPSDCANRAPGNKKAEQWQNGNEEIRSRAGAGKG